MWRAQIEHMELAKLTQSSSVRCELSIIISGLLIICTTIVEPRPICNHNQYRVVNRNGSFRYCRDCPPCHIGTGLTYECPSVINTDAEVKCVDCVDGSTFNDIDKGQSVVCKGCNIEEHRVVRELCTKTQDTQYADACEPGYHFVGEAITGSCRLCSCCKKNKLQQTCVEIGQGVPPGTKCKCPDVSLESNKNTSASDNATVGPTKAPVTAHRKTATGGTTGPSVPVSSSNAGNLGQDWKVYLGLALAIIGIIFVIGAILACLKCTRGTPNNSQEGGACALLQADTSDSCNTSDREEIQLDGLSRISCQPRCSYTSSNPPCYKCYPNDCPLSKADFFLRSYLATKLDLAGMNDHQAGWHEVGKKFDVPSSRLYPLKLEYQKTDGSPTMGLFTLLEARGSENEPSLEKFLKVLMELGHGDIISGWDWRANKEIEQ